MYRRGLQSAAAARTPMIKFVGKRSGVKVPSAPVAAAKKAPPSPGQVQQLPVKHVKAGTGVDFATLNGKAWFGRPQFSAKEMEAIASGGASEI